jgi:E3 ubiquitin-protein ligase RAD18
MFIINLFQLLVANAPVPCPMCNKAVRLNLVDSHIESGCKSHVFSNEPSKSASKNAWASIFKNKASSSTSEEAQIPTTKLPKVSYGTFNLSNLRKLLSEKGLPSTGDKDELITRHERY